MCIACALPKGTKISQKEFENCWKNNPDGGGYAFIKQGGIFVVKKSLDFDQFSSMFEKDHKEHGSYSNFLLHFRIRSVGAINEENCHPFEVNPRVLMMHNGTISKMKPTGDDSDTKKFAEFLGKLQHNFFKNESINHLIDEYIGGGNKIVLLENYDGNIVIYNEKAGTWDNDRWFSNTSFRQSWSAPKNSGSKSSSAHYNYYNQYEDNDYWKFDGVMYKKIPLNAKSAHGKHMYPNTYVCKICFKIHNGISNFSTNVAGGVCDKPCREIPQSLGRLLVGSSGSGTYISPRAEDAVKAAIDFHNERTAFVMLLDEGEIEEDKDLDNKILSIKEIEDKGGKALFDSNGEVIGSRFPMLSSPQRENLHSLTEKEWQKKEANGLT